MDLIEIFIFNKSSVTWHVDDTYSDICSRIIEMRFTLLKKIRIHQFNDPTISTLQIFGRTKLQMFYSRF